MDEKATKEKLKEVHAKFDELDAEFERIKKLRSECDRKLLAIREEQVRLQGKRELLLEMQGANKKPKEIIPRDKK